MKKLCPDGRADFSRPRPCELHEYAPIESCTACQAYVEAMDRFAARNYDGANGNYDSDDWDEEEAIMLQGMTDEQREANLNSF